MMAVASSSILVILHILLVASGSTIIRPPLTWRNDLNLKLSSNSDNSQVRIILCEPLSSSYYVQSILNNVPTALCGFYCFTMSNCTSFFFAVIILSCHIPSNSSTCDPQLVWTANRNHPVGENATLTFSEDGNLLLKDSDGTLVWSTNTTTHLKSMFQLRLSSPGRLQIVDADHPNVSIWDSFDHPTDTWLLGQSLSTTSGQQLWSRTSDNDLSTGQFFLRIVPNGWKAYINSDPPRLYHSRLKKDFRSDNITFVNGELVGSTSRFIKLRSSQISSLQYMRLDSDGHLLHYVYTDTWNVVESVFNVGKESYCAYPTVCGANGICSNNEQCSCMDETYFKPIDRKYLARGCYPVTPISCKSNNSHHLIPLNNASYFIYQDLDAAVVGITDQEKCQQACLKNCSCKAALFRTLNLSSINGYCYLPSQLYSMMNYDPNASGYKSFAYVKVQVQKVDSVHKTTHNKMKILLGSLLTFTLVGSLFIGLGVFKMRNKFTSEMDDELEQVYGLPKRFTYEELKLATNNFSNKLGQGGFGSVFKGVMDGNSVAVKRIDNIGQGAKEFLAEVLTIGNVHHIHLVRLIGFCSEKPYRMLVYEYMSKGSLDKWIFYKNNNFSLDWKTRVQIITEVAKALAYLHEDCRQRIIHLDIKPQNILLDEEFHAKVSDFGLSKLIDKDKSHVITTMRGTFGYLAPEWLTSKITEKADVYSFGVVVLEVVCGRRNLDYSQDEEREHLIALLHDKVKECRITDILDNDNNDTQLYKEEMIKMIKVATWCLHNDQTKRPSMTEVVKVLDGSTELQTNVAINFSVTTRPVNAGVWGDSSAPSASVLSAGR